jgi:hypothetical protein
MSRIAILVLAATVLLGAESPWTKVKDLKSRTELRIYKKGAREPLVATFDEANEERVLVVVRNEQIAIQRDDIDRIDARPARTPGKVNVEHSEKQTDPDPVPNPRSGPAVPGASASSNVSVGGGSRPDFETVYRRQSGSAKN